MKGIDRVRRARSQLVMGGHPFYGALLLELELQETTEFDTMATDGKRLLVNAAFADSLPDKQLRGVLVHECMHCAYCHHTRRGNRDPERWNEACDYAINRDIERDGFELPPFRLYDVRFEGKSAEEIYVILAKEAAQSPKKGKPGAGDPGGCGQILDAAPSSQPAKIAEEKAKWEAKVFSAAAIAKAQAGKIPYGLQRRIDEQRRPPKENWREVLRRFIDQSTVKDFAWSRPNRRFIAGGRYLPGMVSDASANILAGIDTSGSIDERCLSEFASELQGVMDSGACDTLSVIYCDTEAAGEHDIQRGETVKLNPVGYGGTDFAPVMAWAAEKQAACLIYFTDLCCESFGADPGLPVLWATWTRATKAPPFGEVIQIDPYDR